MYQHPDTRKLVLWGGTCMAVPQQVFQQQPGGCLVGSGGGAVFRCSLDANSAALQAFAQVSNFASLCVDNNTPYAGAAKTTRCVAWAVHTPVLLFRSGDVKAADRCCKSNDHFAQSKTCVAEPRLACTGSQRPAEGSSQQPHQIPGLSTRRSSSCTQRFAL